MPRRGTLVGEAYVVMRADGSLMKRDMQDAASQAGEAGGDNFGSEFRKSWDAQIKKFENEQLPRFRDSITRMAADVDFQPFIRQFKSIDAARKSLDASLNDYMREGLLSEEDKNLIVDRFEQSVVSLRKMEAETKKAADSAERAKHSFRNLMSQDEVNRAIRFGKQLAAAKIDKTFDNMAIKGESAAQAVERITADLKKYQRELSISNVEVHNFTRALEKWRP